MQVASTKLLGGALLALLLAAALFRPAGAAAASPCWKALLNDWYDGHIDHTYPLHCYRDALSHLPADVQTYSSAHDDIERALQSAIALEHRKGTKVGPNTLLAPPATTTTGAKTTTSPTETNAGVGADTVPTTEPGRTTPSGLSGVADELNTSNSTSLPLPLLVLGGLALLLLAAGGVGLLIRHIQARKGTP